MPEPEKSASASMTTSVEALPDKVTEADVPLPDEVLEVLNGLVAWLALYQLEAPAEQLQGPE